MCGLLACPRQPYIALKSSLLKPKIKNNVCAYFWWIYRHKFTYRHMSHKMRLFGTFLTYFFSKTLSTFSEWGALNVVCLFHLIAISAIWLGIEGSRCIHWAALGSNRRAGHKRAIHWSKAGLHVQSNLAIKTAQGTKNAVFINMWSLQTGELHSESHLWDLERAALIDRWSLYAGGL